jgi:hypothetical protein
MRLCDLCLDAKRAEVFTPHIDGRSFAVCREHFDLFAFSSEDIGLWEWCRRILSVTEIGVSVLCDWFDSMAVGS